MTAHRKLLKEGGWVLVGQLGSALGTLLGIRALTEFVVPEIYGGVTLLLGMTALALGTIVSPVMQAAMRYYPEYSDGKVSTLRSSVVSLLSKRILIFLSLVSICTPLVTYFSGLGIKIIVLCSLLLVLDAMRTLEYVLLNASRKQKTYAAISLAEAWGRPFMAVFGVHFLGVGAETVLTAYAFTSAFILFIFYGFSKPIGLPVTLRAESALKFSLQRYALPLVPMAGLGWVNGVGDRYLIGGLLGLTNAGVYSAVYGLLSRPFLMVSGVVELTLRPHYYRLVAEQKHNEAKRLLTRWLVAVAGLVSIGFAGVLLFDDLIIKILLAEKYRDGLALMPWIAGGYVFLALTDVYVKVCYAYKYTERILKIQIVGAVLSITSVVFGIKLFGLLGAAMAVPVYFGVMLIVTIIASKVNIKK